MRNHLLNLPGYSVLTAILVLVSIGADARAAEPNAPAGNLKPTDPAATVNGVDILESQVQEAVDKEFERTAQQQTKISRIPALQLGKQVRQRALRRLILDQLLHQQADAEKIEVTKDDIIAHLKQQGAKQKPPVSLEQIKKKFEAKGETFDAAIKRMQKDRRLRHKKLTRLYVEGKINVTEQDAKDYYDQNQEDYHTPEKVRVSHILIEPDTVGRDIDTNKAREKAKNKAEELLKQIRAGADFAKMAQAHSDDFPTVPKAGDVGFIVRGWWPPPFEQAAFKLRPGQISDLVETERGYHIIKVTDHQAAKTTSFEEAKKDIISQLTEQERRRLITEYINSLMAKAKIVYHDDTFEGPSKTTIRYPERQPDDSKDVQPPP
ncbi:MAG: peptidylprolyl isomerase [Planctomycetota bacterium]|jgi:peptidyl-prolyl cis-trans isomerase C